METRPCLAPLITGTGVATMSFSASLKTAFLAYARARERVRGGPKNCGGVKAEAPTTVTRRRAATGDGAITGVDDGCFCQREPITPNSAA
eukprot:scaffold49548_cov62-Phaeocystis_antarctica.AAC.3